jgi:fibronectin type 3 domain-containing protein
MPQDAFLKGEVDMKRNLIGAMWVMAACGVFAQALPAEWIDVPFGTYTAAYEGGSTYHAGVFTVTGSGNNMYDTANDGGRFVFQPLLGDCEVIARVKLPTAAGLDYGARAGVMIRQQNNRGSLNMLFCRMKGDATNIGRISASGRLTLGGTTTALSTNGFSNTWMPLRLIRQGNTVRAYLSQTEVAAGWEPYRSLTVPMGEAVNAGLFVSRYSVSTAQLMTNDFDQVTVRQLVTVQTNLTAGLDVSWVTDLPDLANGWSYTYTVTRTAEGGTVVTQAQDLAVATYIDNAAVVGTYYRYAVTAVPVPQEGFTSPPDVLLGASAAVRLPNALTNLMSGLPQGLFAGYYSPTGSLLALLTRVEASVTNAAVPPTAAATNSYVAVLNASLLPEATDLYTFFAHVDDGLRLYVGDTLVLDTWWGGDYKASSAPVWLEAGRSYPVRVEYWQSTGGRRALFQWRRAGDPLTVAALPASAFSPVPLPWRHEDIGAVALNGNASFDSEGGSLVMTANGNALDGAADACHLVSRDASGDFDLTARLDSLTGAGAARLAGLTVRANLTPGASSLTLAAVPGATEYAVYVLQRGQAGAAASVASTPTTVAVGAALWLRLVRTGTAVTAYYRADADAEWTAVGAASLLLGPTCKLGVVASSADAAGAAEATFGAWGVAVAPVASLKPTQDAYVRANNLNYGTAAELVIKRVSGDTQRDTFLRFNVAGQTAARSAVLRLYLSSRDASPAVQEVGLRRFLNVEWSETTAVWTNAPGGVRLPTAFIADDDPTLVARGVVPQAVGQYLEFDVSDAVREAAAGTGDLTFELFPLTSVGGNPANFGSKENTTAARQPALVLSYDAPQGVRAEAGPDTGQATVTWQACPGAGAYRIYRAEAADGTYAQVGGDTGELRIRDTGLTVGQRTFYKVTALTADGETARSEAAWADAKASATAIVSEDTFVNGGPLLSNEVYGTSIALTVKYNAASTATHREAYLLFNDIAGLGHVERAVLRVVPSTASGGGNNPALIPVQFIRMPANTWSETTVTFMKPPPGYPPPTPRLTDRPASERVTAPCVAVGATLEVDVTEIVREAARINADNKLSVGILRMDSDGSFNLGFYSSEATNYWPKMVYTLGRPMAPTAVATNGYVALSWLPYRGATGYVVRRAVAGEASYTTLGSTAETSFKDLTAEAGAAYTYTLAAVTAGGETEPSLPAAACVEAREERYPVADTSLDGGAADTNYGRNTTIPLKRAPARENLFKFEVAGLEAAASVRFRACVSAADTGYVPVNLIVRHDDFGDWNEDGVTYNNPPRGYLPPSVSTAEKGANELARIFYAYKDIASYENWVEADVTEAVRQAAQAGQRYVTLMITGDDTLQHGTAYMNTASRESGTLLKRPVLLCSGRRFGAPQGLRLEPLAEGPGFTLSWCASAGAARYIVTRRGPTDEETVVVADDVTGTSYTDAGAAYWTDRDYTYTVAAVHADGTVSAAAGLTRSLTRTFVRPVTADTFVRGGASTNSTYGGSAVVEVKGDSNLDYQREGFFRVAATNLPAFAAAHLRLVLNSTNLFTDSTVVLKVTPDTGWAESGAPAATWEGVLGAYTGATPDPGAGDPDVIARFNLKAAGYGPGDEMVFDLTRPLKAAQANAADTLLVHMLIVTPNGGGNISVRSLQAAMLDDVPSVLYTVPAYPAPGSVMLLR